MSTMNARLRGRIAAILASSTALVVAGCEDDITDGDGRAGSRPGGNQTGGRDSGGASSGGSPSGGSPGEQTAGIAGRDEVGACFNPGVGTCCNTRMCFSNPGELGQYIREHQQDDLLGPDILGPGGAGGASGTGGANGFDNGCPDVQASWLCGWFRSGSASEINGQCCYVITSGTCCGRPFLVGGRQRLPGVALRADWCGAAASAPCTHELDPYTRAALVDLWLESARLEHASVAAFARFVLELLAVGAPAALVIDAQRAGADEIEHARACFALASRHAGAALGPDRLDTTGACDAPSLAGAVALAVTEGCVGETVAAALAERQASVAADPEARAVLLRIAEDEARHAELAWRFVVWALETGGAGVHAAVREAFESALAPSLVETTDPRVDMVQFHAHGGLLPSERAAVRADALQQIVAPCARVLTASAPSALRSTRENFEARSSS